MAEARVIRFRTQVGYIKSQHTNDKLFLKGRCIGSRDPFYILGPPMISLERMNFE